MNLKIYYKIYKYNMKSINFYINEALKLGKSRYSCHPKTKEELQKIINKRIKEEGNKCNLNDIDVSYITDMSYLFEGINFNGDISDWDVSNVTNMEYMFFGCYSFNQDISKWDVSNVTNMYSMFRVCRSFNQDISSWDVSNVTNMSEMFYKCFKFNQDISKWDVSNVNVHTLMFYYCKIEEKYKPKFK